jgi:hypothetical protein
MNRRKFVYIITAGGLMSVLPACDEMPASAVAPWDGPPAALTDTRLRALSWALLAPNPHNLQSWIADVREPDTVVLFVDRTRLLPETDPESRQILIGCGAFLELFVEASAAYGFKAVVQLFPEGPYPSHAVDHRPFARIRIERMDVSAERSNTLQAMGERRSTKVAYTDRVPSANDFGAFARASGSGLVVFKPTIVSAAVTAITGLAKQGCAVELGTRRILKESLTALRLGADAIAHDPTGIPLRGPLFWWGRRIGLISERTLNDPDNSSVQRSLKRFSDLMDFTPAWGWLVSEDNSRLAQIEAGRAYLRINLEATRRGIGVHPASQVLQEFPEIAGLYGRFHHLVGVVAPRRVQMLFRIGFTDASIPPTPRRALNKILIS